MKCKKCGTENPDDAQFCTVCGEKFEGTTANADKSMFAAIIISFILTGLGIAYAGNKKKGIIKG